MKFFFKNIIFFIVRLYYYLLKNTKIWLFINNTFIYFSMNNYKKINHNNCSLKFINPTVLINYRIKTFSIKEPETLDWIDTFSDDSILWDVGANIGLYSCYASKKKNMKVFAFEPSVFNLEILSRNIFINNLNDKISILPIPLNNKKMINDLSLTSTELGGAMSTFAHNYGHDGEEINALFRYRTIGLSMDDCINFLNIPQPDHIKIDVDGIEHLILEGGKNVITNVKSILIEVNDDFKTQNEQTNHILTSLNFKLLNKTHAEHFNFSDSSEQTTFNQIWINQKSN